MSTKKGAGAQRAAKTNPVAEPVRVPVEVQPAPTVVEPSELPGTELQPEAPAVVPAEPSELPKVEKSTLSPTQKLVQKYSAAYPDNKVFYVTSDLQLFLSGDYNLALLHQKTIGGELETIKI